MKSINIRSALLGLGLGLICASIILFYILTGGSNPPSGAEITGTDGNALPVVRGAVFYEPDDAGYTLLSAERVIFLDGNEPRAIDDAERAALRDRLSGVAVENAAIIGRFLEAGNGGSTTEIASQATAAISAAATTAPTTTTATTSAAATTAPTTTAASTTSPAVTTSPVATPDNSVTFVITRGDTATIVAKNLYDAGLTADSGALLNRIIERELTRELHEGTYQIEFGLSIDALIDRIRVKK